MPWSRKTGPDLLVVRPGSTVKRDIYKAATVGATGLTAFGALAVTGAVAGTAAHQKALEDAAKPAPPAPPAAAAAPAPQRRVHKTVVRTRVVHVASASTVARPASGGTVVAHTSPTSSSHTSSSGSSSTTTHSAPAPAPKPVAPPAPKPAPKPAPAPTSGS